MVIRKYHRTRDDGVKLYKTYTDKGEYYLKQVETGILYYEPIDIENAPYTYEETDVKLGNEETE